MFGSSSMILKTGTERKNYSRTMMMMMKKMMMMMR
jgi:hypothetical protein